MEPNTPQTLEYITVGLQKYIRRSRMGKEFLLQYQTLKQ